MGSLCIFTVTKQSQMLLYGKGRPGMIKGIALGTKRKHEEEMIPITDVGRPTALDFDIRSQYIYYSDGQRYLTYHEYITFI